MRLTASRQLTTAARKLAILPFARMTSALGQKQTFAVRQRVSAKGQKPISRHCLRPATVGCEGNRKGSSIADNLIDITFGNFLNCSDAAGTVVRGA